VIDVSATDPGARDTDLVALEESEQELAALEAELAQVDGAVPDDGGFADRRRRSRSDAEATNGADDEAEPR